MYRKNAGRIFWVILFWTPILFKCYQNRFVCGTVKGYDCIWRSERVIRLCSTECLFCNNRKGSRKTLKCQYVRFLFQKLFFMAFLKRTSTAGIFLGLFRLFLRSFFIKHLWVTNLEGCLCCLVGQLIVPCQGFIKSDVKV